VYALELFIESRQGALYASSLPAMVVLADSTDKAKDAASLGEAFGVSIDTRTADDVLGSFRRQGIDGVPIITPSTQLFLEKPDGTVTSAISFDGHEIMPLGAVSDRMTVLCNEGGQWVHYRSDPYGFRNSAAAWSRERVDLIALGDSFTHGYCVPNDDNFFELIHQQFPAALNLGIAGDGPLLMLAKLKEYASRFRPRHVLWFYYEGNDLVDLQRERKSALLRQYLTDKFTQPGLVHQEEIDRAMIGEIPRLRALEEERRKRREDNRAWGNVVTFASLSHLRQAVGLVGGIDADGAKDADFTGENLSVFREVLRQASTEVRAWGGTLVFVYLPEWARFSNYESLGKARRDDVLRIVQTLGIPLIDLVPAFNAYGDSVSLFPFRRQGHYTERGHRLVAQEVLRALPHTE
jgi:hypothetical protein